MIPHLECLQFLIVHRLVGTEDASRTVFGEDPFWMLIHSHAKDFKSDLVRPLHFNLQHPTIIYSQKNIIFKCSTFRGDIF